MFLFKIAPSEICLPARQLAAHHGDDCCDVVSLMAPRRHLCDGSDRRRDSYGRGGYGGSHYCLIFGDSNTVMLFYYGSFNSEETKKHQAAEVHKIAEAQSRHPSDTLISDYFDYFFFIKEGYY